MNPAQDFAAIANLDLEPIKLKLMHAESGEGWSQERVDAVEKEYRRFLYLMKQFPHEQTSPLVDVDTFWHYHILDTMKYAADCEQAFGYFLHHYPYVGLGGADDAEVHRRSAERMKELYEATFGEEYARTSAEADAYCGVSAQKAAYCGVAAQKAAYCGVAGQKTAYCGVAAQTAAYCGVATQKAAYCGVTAQKAAYCGVAAQKTAYCGATAPKTAYCGVTQKAAYCGVAAQKSAYCGVAATKAAYCGVAPQATQGEHRDAAEALA